MRPLSNEQRKWLTKIKNSDKLKSYEQMQLAAILKYNRYCSVNQSK